MKKSELLAFGIPEEKLKAFQAAYWNDCNNAAQRMAAKLNKANNTAEETDLREAIIAMLRLIHDPARLKRLLEVTNSQYYNMCREIKESEQETQNAAPIPPGEEGGGA